MPMVMHKDEAHKLIERMPQNATWDDLMVEIYVREAIEHGLADSNEGRTKDLKQVREKYGLPVILPANPGLTFTLPDSFQQKSKPQSGCIMR